MSRPTMVLLRRLEMDVSRLRMTVRNGCRALVMALDVPIPEFILQEIDLPPAHQEYLRVIRKEIL